VAISINDKIFKRDNVLIDIALSEAIEPLLIFGRLAAASEPFIFVLLTRSNSAK